MSTKRTIEDEFSQTLKIEAIRETNPDVYDVAGEIIRTVNDDFEGDTVEAAVSVGLAARGKSLLIEVWVGPQD